jgi:hypothetical protein
MCSEGANCDVLVSVPCGEISTQHISSKRHVGGGGHVQETEYGNGCGTEDIDGLMNLLV